MQQQPTMNIDLYHVIGEKSVQIEGMQFYISQLQAQNKKLQEQVGVLTTALADKRSLEDAAKDGQGGKLIDEVTKALEAGAKKVSEGKQPTG